VPGQTLLGGAILDTRNFKTDLTAKNGQTLVLAVLFNGRSPTRCVKPRFSEAFRACAGSSTRRTRPAGKSNSWSSCVESGSHTRGSRELNEEVDKKAHWSRNGEMTSSLQKEKRAQLRSPKVSNGFLFRTKLCRICHTRLSRTGRPFWWVNTPLTPHHVCRCICGHSP